ncbi:hypothetical protein [Streptomyces europaeiscabiei]|uniref:hypothetical protein n=1 Tax=Streptomyces europaeiscabiei TaxID=146819 RepID=UPI0038F809E7
MIAAGAGLPEKVIGGQPFAAAISERALAVAAGVTTFSSGGVSPFTPEISTVKPIFKEWWASSSSTLGPELPENSVPGGNSTAAALLSAPKLTAVAACALSTPTLTAVAACAVAARRECRPRSRRPRVPEQ